MDAIEAIYALQDGLPRNGPGSDALTRQALDQLAPLPPAPRVLDLGCGRGRSTRILVKALGPAARIVAVDLHAPFLDALARDLVADASGAQVETRCVSMGDCGEAPGSVDLIWSEGAAYAIGFESALRAWRPLLRTGGRAALSECSWLTDRRPDELAAYWREAYPAMGTIADNLDRARRAGWSPLGTIVFPSSAWWDDYYRPLQARMLALRTGPAVAPALTAEMAATELEIAMFERFGSSYGCVFYLLAAT